MVLLLLLRWLPGLVIRPQRRQLNLDPGDLGFKFEAVTLKAFDRAELAAFYVPATVPARGNLVLLHGKDSAKELYLEYLPQLVGHGYNLLLYDARAHGRSQGEFTTFGYREWRDAVSAATYLRYLGGDLPTGVFGHSLGGAVALQAMARSRAIDFGIVESTFTHLGEITHAYFRRRLSLPVPRWFSDLILDEADKLAQFHHRSIEPLRAARDVTQPTLIIHGEADQAIDVDHGRQLYAALSSTLKELYIVPGAGHDNLTEVGDDGYWWRLRAFLQSVTE